jgi:hypothetical protein
MTIEQSDPSQADDTSAEAGTAGTSQADATVDERQTKTGTAAFGPALWRRITRRGRR